MIKTICNRTIIFVTPSQLEAAMNYEVIIIRNMMEKQS